MLKKNPSVLWNVDQSLDASEKAKARENIGVSLDSNAAGDPTLTFVTGKKVDSSTGVVTLNTANVKVSNTYSSIGTDPVNGKAIAKAFETLDIEGGKVTVQDGYYIDSIDEVDGIVKVTTAALSNSVQSGDNKAVTSDAVNTAVSSKADNITYTITDNTISNQLTVDPATGSYPLSDRPINISYGGGMEITSNRTGSITFESHAFYDVYNDTSATSYDIDGPASTSTNCRQLIPSKIFPVVKETVDGGVKLLTYLGHDASVTPNRYMFGGAYGNTVYYKYATPDTNNGNKLTWNTTQKFTTNNGLLSIDIGGTVYNTGFTANSSWNYNASTAPNDKFSFPAAAYSTSGGSTTYTAGYMSGEDKEKLDHMYPIQYTKAYVGTSYTQLDLYEYSSSSDVEVRDIAVNPTKTFGYLVPIMSQSSPTKCLMYLNSALRWIEPQTLQVKHWTYTNSVSTANTKVDAITIPQGQVAMCEIKYTKETCSYINVDCNGTISSWVGQGSSQSDGLESLALNRVCFIADAHAEAKVLKVESRAKSSSSVVMELTAVYGIETPDYSTV